MKKILVFMVLVLPMLSIAQVVEDSPVFEVVEVEQKATFPGGDAGLQKYIANNVKYPPQALEQDAQGTVIVMFVVNSDASVSDTKTIGDEKNKYLEAEAKRVIKSTSGMWSPAMQKGKAVRMRYRVPIKFHIY
jgi:protein TonB